MQKYTKEQFWKLYEKLPQELKDTLWAEETGNNIKDVCQRYEIEENLEDIVDLVGQVLVGVLAPEDFQRALEKELKLEKETAKKVGREINRFVFYPVKTELENLYQTKITSTTEKIIPAAEEKLSFAKTTDGKEEKPAEPKKEDTYREPAE